MTPGSKGGDPRIQKVRDTIDHDPAVTRKQLQIKARLSRSRLDELFKRHVGIRLGDYIRARRLKEAAKLLETSEPNTSEPGIKEIAHRIGYKHSSSFVRSFKLFFGVSPSDYRRSHREKS